MIMTIKIWHIYLPILVGYGTSLTAGSKFMTYAILFLICKCDVIRYNRKLLYNYNVISNQPVYFIIYIYV